MGISTRMGLVILFVALFFMTGWLAAGGALGYAVATAVRVRHAPWLRGSGHPAARLLLPAPAYLRLDRAVAVFALLADLWLVSGVLVLGSDGVFAEDWMGYGGMQDPAARQWVTSVVGVLHTTAWWSFGAAVLCRWWTTAALQLCLLPLAAAWIGSLETY